MAISTNITNFWNNLSFTNDVRKMRKALMEYFKEEGITYEVKEGALLFEYHEDWFVVNFAAGKEYAECGIVYSLEDDSYASLDVSDKTYIAANTNNEIDSHATVQVYNENIKAFTTFYFTSKKMMMHLFLKHFDELRECISMAIRLTRECINEAQKEADESAKTQQIGFCVQKEDSKEKR